MPNRKSTRGFPTSCKWSAYVTLKSPNGGSKSDFFVFLMKVNFDQIKYVTKLLCVKISSGIVVSNGSYILARNVTLQPKI